MSLDPLKTSKEAHEKVASFVKQDPQAVYTLDGERTQQVSELCRRLPQGGVSCLKLNIASREMFAIMQKLDYFCTLPQDPAKTYMECKLIQTER